MPVGGAPQPGLVLTVRDVRNSQRMLCTDCFENEGLAQTARSVVADGPAIDCPVCRGVTGRAIRDAEAADLIRQFFVEGSRIVQAANVNVFKLTSENGMMTGEFEEPLQADYRRLVDHYGLGTFHHAPRLWRFGYTDHYWAIEEGDAQARDAALTKVTEACGKLTLPVGTKLLRIRNNVRADGLAASSYDAPPAGVHRTYGRFDDADLPMLYAAFDLETCVHECRCIATDEITLATFDAARELSLLNFQEVDEPEPGYAFGCVGHFLRGLTANAEERYPMCRLVARKIRELGFDGFVYRSFFSCVRPQELANVALFGWPVREGKLSLRSLNRVRLEEVTYKLGLGPVNVG